MFRKLSEVALRLKGTNKKVAKGVIAATTRKFSRGTSLENHEKARNLLQALQAVAKQL